MPPWRSQVVKFGNRERWQVRLAGTDGLWFQLSTKLSLLGRSGTIRTGPYFDHTFRNTSGRYVFFESSGLARDISGSIRTPMIYIDRRKEDVYCVSLWVSMYGSEMGKIEVFAHYYDNQESDTFTKFAHFFPSNIFINTNAFLNWNKYN